MKKKSRPSLEGKGRDIFFDDDKTLEQHDALSTIQQDSKKTYKQ